MAHKKRRSAAQKAATRRMIAARRAGYASNPSPRKRHHRRRTYASNPSIGHHARRAYHSIRHHVRRKYRRNPSPRLGGLGSMMMPAVYGAGGALAIDFVTGYLPLPLAIKVSPARHLLKGLMAVGLGMVFRGRIGSEMAKGGLTVALHDAAREAIQMVAPTVQLGAEPTIADLQAAGAGMGYYNPSETAPALGFYQDAGMAGMGETVQDYTI